MKETDEILMQRYKKGDINAFNELYSRHKSKVYGFLISRLKDVNKADEVFQNVFVKLHRKKDQYDPKHEFIKWLFVITRTQMLDYLKAQKSSEEFVEELHSKDAIEQTQRLDFGQVDTLSDKERSALSMRYYEESEFAEIAEALGTSPSNARQIISRGIKKLKAALAGE